MAELGHQVVVARNDKITIDQIYELAVDAIIYSPGPGTPDDAGISLESIREFAGKDINLWYMFRASGDWAGFWGNSRLCQTVIPR